MAGMNWVRVGVGLGVGTAVALTPAMSATSQQQAFARWKLQDKCVLSANRLYPDHTPSALLQRDQSVRKCLENAGQPPRDPLLRDIEADGKPGQVVPDPEQKAK